MRGPLRDDVLALRPRHAGGESGKVYRNTPSWISNDRVLVFGGFLRQVNHDTPGGYDDDDDWFDDSEMFGPSADLGDGEAVAARATGSRPCAVRLETAPHVLRGHRAT